MQMQRMSLELKKQVLHESINLIDYIDEWAGDNRLRQYVALAALEGMEQLRDIPEKV